MKPLALSRYQARFFNTWKNAPDDIISNLQYVFELKGEINIELLKQACGLLLVTNDIFQMRFDASGKSGWRQNYSIDRLFNIIRTPADHNVQIEAILYSPLNLCADPLLQFYLIEHSTEKNCHFFIIKSHHIVIDGSCARNVCKFISSAYNALLTGSNLPLPFCRYADYLEYENQLMNLTTPQQLRTFWINFLQDVPLFTKIPTKTKPLRKLHPVEQLFFTIRGKSVSILNQFAANNNSTIFTVIAALYGQLLANYSQQEKFAITYPVNLRGKNCMTAAGSFINNIFLKFDFSRQPSLTDLIIELNQQRQDSKKYHQQLFTDIIDSLERKADDFINIGLVQGNINIEPLELLATTSTPWPTFTKSLAYQMRLVYDQSIKNSITFRLDYAIDEIEPNFAQEFMAKLEKNLIHIQNHSDKISLKR